MSLTVIIDGKPHHVNQVSISANNSIAPTGQSMMPPPMFQQPTVSPAALQPSLSNPTNSELSNINSQQLQHSQNLINTNKIQQDTLDSYNNNMQAILNNTKRLMEKSNLTEQDKTNINTNEALSHIYNHANHFGVPPELTEHPIFKPMLRQAQQYGQPPMYPQQEGQPPPMFQNGQINVKQTQQQSNQENLYGGSKKRRNKRKKRTRKQRRSRKGSSKR